MAVGGMGGPGGMGPAGGMGGGMGPAGGVAGGGRPSAQSPDPSPSRPDLRRVLALFRPYRGTLLGVLALIVVGAATGVVSPFLIREIVDVALPEQRADVLAWTVGGLIAVTIVSSALGVTQAMLSTRVGQSVMHDLRVAVFTHLQRMGLGFFTRTRTGEIQSRIFSDIGSMQAVVTSVMTQIVSAGAAVVMALVAMLALDWRLTLFSLVALPFAVWMNRRVGRRRREIVRTRQEKAADLSAGIQESLSVSGILLGVTMGRTEALSRTFAQDSHELADLEVRSTMAGRWQMAVFTTAMALFPALTYFLGGHLMFSGADVTIGTLVAFIALQSTLFPQINGLLRVATQVNSSLALFTRVFEYLDAPILIQDAPHALALDPAAVLGEIRFEDVTFTYPGADEPALDGIDLVIPAGAHTALVGATGSGKTSTGYLMARLYEPTSGAVTLDGHDLRDLTMESLAASIGVVTQETYLLHASIADNLRFARPGASDEELVRACRIAQIHEHIEALPEGYGTVVGERGYRFSGGEKQRLALARTILRDPPVLLLDEATSALDVATERAMAGALDAAARGRTTVSIAHRLSTVRHADQILVLEGGRIAERGTYDELVERGGLFAELALADARRDAEAPDAAAQDGTDARADVPGGADVRGGADARPDVRGGAEETTPRR
ncbi:ABC transporter ATP-binding protein [Brachybacterium saurashtrense]|uniref:ABC transporter ATP-binding protein n=1 Tax=Brachybacterium saurashtrense TaxID=556288 RepID=A0A345YKT6_9MICO|nr:ABC transporter ATP-binding protein [Brachybacterium saurashtrense]AXK44538.1 ABC transporter ATP-binding protein [Brachybacterium saurashtrense]RRR23150.1 ABC transporter ATP-binding protein [Brachybacterium saurashtrense]